VNFAQMQNMLNENLAPAAVSLVRRTSLAYTAYMENPGARYDAGGKYFRVPIHTARGYAAAFLDLETDQIPNAAEPSYNEFHVDVIDLASPFELTTKALYSSEAGDDVSFASAARETFENAVTSAKLRMDVSVLHQQRGILGTVGAGGLVGGDAVDLTPAAADYQSLGAWLLPVGLRVDVINPVTGLVRAGGSNLPVASHSNRNEIVVTGIGASATVANDWIVQSNTYNKCMTGLRAIIDDGTNTPAVFQNIDRTAAGNSMTQSYLDTNAGVVRALTEDLIMDHVARQSMQSPGDIDFATTHTSIGAHLSKLLKDDRRFNPKPGGTSYPAGFGHFEFFTGSRTLRFLSFDWHPARTIYFQEKKRIFRLDLVPFRIADEDGSGFRRTGRTDPLWGFYKWIGNLGTDAPNCHSELGALDVAPDMGGGVDFLTSW
jgi:hypothetical protein